ncbi:MAG: nitroreductase family protein [Lachnospiraceae bacterium]|nr:nitroreductase family protein [Lachnospiraceae bacterium]
MEFSKLVKERFSCKKYSDRKVEREVLNEILEAGRVAPTAKNLQEQKIFVIESEEKLKAFDTVCPCRYGAPTVLVVGFEKDNVFVYPGERKNSGDEDATIVATHMMLAATNAGVDNCWLNKLDPDEMVKALGLPENVDVVMALDLGYAAEGGVPLPNHSSRKALEETVVFM